jgi:hypothetical protein
VVSHPRDWEWVGYHEIMGSRQRYRLLDVERLCWRLGMARVQEVRLNMEAALGEAIQHGALKRDPTWTESLAVGSAGFVEKIKPLILTRRETEIIPAEEDTWVLQEPSSSYGQETGLKSGPKHEN